MKNNRIVLVFLVISMFGVGSAFADATVDQNTKMHFEGALGRVLNFFGGRATREGVDSTEVVKGDRKARISGDNGEIIDLDEEKVYKLDYRRKTYTVTTFDELRKQYEEDQERAEKQEPEKPKKPEKAEKKQEPEYAVDVDIKDTGKKETIAGFATHEEIVTVTIHEKGKKIEESGGTILIADMWIGPHVPALEEVRKFSQRYTQKLYGEFEVPPGMDPRAMAQVTVAAPSFKTAMKAYGKKQSSLEGTPLRTTMTFESVAAPGQENESEDEGSSPEDAAARAIGGFLSRHRKHSDENPNRSTLFTSTHEIRRADLTVDPSRLAVPPGFRETD